MLAKVRSRYHTAFDVFTVTFVAAEVVVPATVKRFVPLRVTVVSSFKLFTLKL